MVYDFDEIVERRNTNSIKWIRYEKDVLPLWVADMDFRSPPPIRTALREAVEHGIFGYENPTTSLREAVARRMGKLYAWKVDPAWVVTVTGLVSGFYAAAQSLAERGEGYVIQPPVYMPFNDLETHLGLTRQEAPLEMAETGGRIEYRMNWDAFSSAFGSRGSKTAFFLLCDPHNPAGISWDEATLRRMADIALGKGAAIVSDEIHAELLFRGTRHRPIASLDPAIEARSVTLVAPSKTFNIAGLFCGFAIIPDPVMRKAYEGAIERMTLHASGLSLIAAEVAYSGDCDEWLAQLLVYLEANRDYALDFMDREMPRLKPTKPESTYLAWIDCSPLGLPNPQAFFLEKARVALNDGAAFGTGGRGKVRLNFACPRSILGEALGRMRAAVDTIN